MPDFVTRVEWQSQIEQAGKVHDKLIGSALTAQINATVLAIALNRTIMALNEVHPKGAAIIPVIVQEAREYIRSLAADPEMQENAERAQIVLDLLCSGFPLR